MPLNDAEKINHAFDLLKTEKDSINAFMNKEWINGKTGLSQIMSNQNFLISLFFDNEKTSKFSEPFYSAFVHSSHENCSKWLETLSFLCSVRGSVGNDLAAPKAQTKKPKDVISTIDEIIECLEKLILRPKELTIFYSWQAETLPKLYRNFIESSLKKAIKNINKDENIPATLVLVQDSRNTSGSPDLVDEIRRKIQNSFVFVGDISFVHKREDLDNDGNAKIDNNGNTQFRHYVNSNVAYESGYADAILGEKFVLLVMNIASGRFEDLPFDLRQRTPLAYDLNNDHNDVDKKEIKERLISNFEEKLRTAYHCLESGTK